MPVLYPYQERVKNLIKAGKSVVLQAPTGAGKTRAALAPFIEAFFEPPADMFPRKCIYTVPMRVLANQFVHEYQGYADKYEKKYRRKIKVTIQTGDQSHDRRFEIGDLIFCTIDQFLSSYLTMPYGLPARLANLNAGALVGSYIVFDEFHLLDPGSTLPTVLYGLKQLAPIAPMLLMTATFSETMLGSLATMIGGEVITVSREEARKIEEREPADQPRRRIWTTASQTLTAEAVLAEHQNRSLVLCNTVERARLLYQELNDTLQKNRDDTTILLLHSRFLPEDRQYLEDQLRGLFGKEGYANRFDSVIAVTTQVIEVGVDITCQTLHTDLAPSSSLIQRAGRCARFPGEQGKVIVYPVEKYGPYGRAKKDPEKDDHWVKEMKASYLWLKEHQGEVFDYEKEQALVNTVAKPRDEGILKNIAYGRLTRAEEIKRVLCGDRDPGDARLLVREVDSRRVLIHHTPDILLSSPYAASGFNLPTNTLRGMLKNWFSQEIELDWRVKRLVGDAYNTGEDNQVDYAWEPLLDASQLSSSSIIVVHPELAGYTSYEGFIPDRGDTGFLSELPVGSALYPEREQYNYRLESYEDHIRLVLQAFQEIVLPELAYPARALEKAAGWREGSMIEAAWLACLFHDLGKLSKGWQGWARVYQKKIGCPMPDSMAAAHTDRESGNSFHQEVERSLRAKNPRPPHAGEAALAAGLCIIRSLDNNELAKATMTAIVRHHSPFATRNGRFELYEDAETHVLNTLDFVPGSIRERLDIKLLHVKDDSGENLGSFIAMPGITHEWLAYLLLARALRRADQEGTSRGSEEK